MAFGNRLISTGGGGIEGPISASLQDLDFGGFSSAWDEGMDGNNGIMYNVNRNSRLIGVGVWTQEASTATYSIGPNGNFSGIAAAPDGTFLVTGNASNIRRFNSSFVAIADYPVSGVPWDVTATDDGFAYTDTNSATVRVYNYSGTLQYSWACSQGPGSRAQGLAWDGGGIWISSASTDSNAVTYKYEKNGTYTGNSFVPWVSRPFSMLGYDPVNALFYGFNTINLQFFGGTPSRYAAIF